MTLSLPITLEPFRKEIEKTVVPFVSVKAIQKSTSIKDSKIGGFPYLPSHYQHPVDDSGIHMALLCQINFEEIPNLDSFPPNGILQFYISKSDEIYGIDFDDFTNQRNFRVIYHENTDLPHLTDFSYFKYSDEDALPFSGEYRLSFSLSKEAVGVSDFRFENSYLSIDLEQTTGKKNQWGEETLYDEFCEHIDNAGHKIGGYAFFTQTDPRDYTTDFDNYLITLLQIDTDDMDNDILWGDSGVGNFFITEEDLKNKSFTRVLYNWDCH
jgi:uncharacterized protein YwqG